MMMELYKEPRFANEIGIKEIIVIIIAYLCTYLPSITRDFLRIFDIQNLAFDAFCSILTHLYGLWIGLFFGYFMSKSEQHRQEMVKSHV